MTFLVVLGVIIGWMLIGWMVAYITAVLICIKYPNWSEILSKSSEDISKEDNDSVRCRKSVHFLIGLILWPLIPTLVHKKLKTYKEKLVNTEEIES